MEERREKERDRNIRINNVKDFLLLLGRMKINSSQSMYGSFYQEN